MYTKLVSILTYDEFDGLVNKHLAPTYRYEVLADQEWNNYNDHYFENVKAEVLDTYDAKKLQDALTDSKRPHYAVWELLTELVNRGVLEAGNYLIRVCW